MAAVEKHLILEHLGLALLFTPPFDKTTLNPGYIKGYPPGLRENGGQYTHAAMWLILAQTKLGEGRKATDLFAMLNPINHASDLQKSETYRVEPYSVAADIYSVEPYVGRGGWTWYTGAAGWMYQAGIEGILGIRREGRTLFIQPCIPDNWSGFSASIELQESHIKLEVDNLVPLSKNQLQAELDGTPLVVDEKTVSIVLIGGRHHLRIFASELMPK